jgi:hypothetical protein
MPVKDFEPINSDGQISAGEFQRLADEVRTQDKITGSGGLTISRNGAGFQLGTQLPLAFWAKITANDAGTPAAHAWTQQRFDDAGAISDDAEGRTGTTTNFPAYSLDGAAVPTDTIVRLYLSQGGDYYLFSPGDAAAGTGLEVRESDGTPTVSAATQIIFSSSQSFLLTDSSGGGIQSVTIELVNASSTTVGVVSLSDQTLGDGTKKFLKNVQLHDGIADSSGFGQLIWGTQSILQGTDLGLFDLPALFWGLGAGLNSAGEAFWSTYLDSDGLTVVLALPFSAEYLGRYDINGLPGVTTDDGSFVGGILVGSPSGVSAGGTGAASFAANAVLVGNGTSAIAVEGPGDTSHVLMGAGGSSPPVFGSAPYQRSWMGL